MVGHEFAFYVTLKPNMVKGEILRVAGTFGVIDLGISSPELKKIIKKSGEKND